MHRKILKNNNKSKRMSGTPKGRIGTILGIQDKNNEWLKVGDKVRILSCNYEGRILWNSSYGAYNLFLSYSMWYGTNEYDEHSYGKSIPIRLDNGEKKNLLFLER